MKITSILFTSLQASWLSGLAYGYELQLPLSGGGNGGQAGLIDASSSAGRPNIVFILTDDQDLHMDSLNHMPLLQKHLLDHGLFYRQHYCTTALCCPSRVTLWTGKAAHNTNVTDVSPPWGGFPKFVSQGLNDNYLPVWLQEAGYNTLYTGKLFNAHTINNYNQPHAAGWNSSDFLLDPYTYSYMNSTYQRNHDEPVSHEGEHTVDVLMRKALGLLDDAANAKKPFFLGLAPIAPHSNVDFGGLSDPSMPEFNGAYFSAPIPAERHKGLFPGLKVPRTPNFNPETPSGAGWIRNLPRQSPANVEHNDFFYRSRIRALQAVDELIENVIHGLERHGILDNTYVIYTSDNGYHIGQHRLQPGKQCGYETDINVPLIIRGPGVPKNQTTSIVTTHTDLAPTILNLLKVPFPANANFDGDPFPLNISGLEQAKTQRHEHINVEYWGFAGPEGRHYPGFEARYGNHTYKALRIIGGKWNLYYSVWCTGEHELYDMNVDAGQMRNLLLLPTTFKNLHHEINNVSLQDLVPRLDSLLLVLKSCKGTTCIDPWRALHPSGEVQSLDDALNPRFDCFYKQDQKRVEFSRCEMGYLLGSEGPQFETDGLVFRDGASWDNWT